MDSTRVVIMLAKVYRCDIVQIAIRLHLSKMLVGKKCKGAPTACCMNHGSAVYQQENWSHTIERSPFLRNTIKRPPFRKIAPKESTLPRTTIPSRVPLTHPSRAPSSSSLPHHPLPSSSLSSRARRRRPSRRCRLQLLPSPPWLPPRRHRGGEHRRGASGQRRCGHRPRRAPARGQ